MLSTQTDCLPLTWCCPVASLALPRSFSFAFWRIRCCFLAHHTSLSLSIPQNAPYNRTSEQSGASIVQAEWPLGFSIADTGEEVHDADSHIVPSFFLCVVTVSARTSEDANDLPQKFPDLFRWIRWKRWSTSKELRGRIVEAACQHGSNHAKPFLYLEYGY